MPTSPTPLAAHGLPPLRWYSHAWRLALGLTASLLDWSGTWEGQWTEHRSFFWLDLVVGVAAFGLYLLRRRWPFRIALLLAAAGSVSAFACGPALLAAVSFATRGEIGRIVLVGVVGVLAGQAYSFTQPGAADPAIVISNEGTAAHAAGERVSTEQAWWNLAGSVFLNGFTLGWGLYTGSRRELVRSLRERARAAEAERDLRIEAARSQERSAIAREMHDVLAHRISRVSMRAGAMTYREDLPAETLREEATVIREDADAALAELRDVLGVLRQPEDGPSPIRPQPTYADVDRLVDEASQVGMSVELKDLIGAEAGVPEAAGRTIYRIIQEGLTNARKHAPTERVHVELAGSPETGIEVTVINQLALDPAPAALGVGFGLIGLAERAALRGGRLEHRRQDSAFVLHAWIPWAP